jgi:ubiquinone/menaquinone biosynthesis C-methylase UbiE
MDPKPDRIVNMASAFYDSCVLFTASDLGVFAKLAEFGRADGSTLAKELNLDLRGARLLLDACVALNLLLKEGSMYHNSPEAETFMVPGKPGCLSDAIRYNRDVYSAWGELSKMVKTGNPVERPEVHLGENSQRTYQFVMAMHDRARWIAQGLFPLVNLDGRKRLLDVGGGSGTFSVLLARKYPQLMCTVIDLPEIAQIAEELIRKQGMQDRVKAISGDYRKGEFPSGYDVVNILGVLHQESPESIQDLLKKGFDALQPGGLLYVLDVMTDFTHTSPKFSALFAVNMALTAKQGWVFSDQELHQWFTKAGFHRIDFRPLPPPMPHWLASAQKP